MDQFNSIILCAGNIDQLALPVGTNISNAMVPLNGKPVIGWILDDLLQKNITKVTIVHHPLDSSLPLFVRWAYSPRMEIVFAHPEECGTILESLMAGIQALPGTVKKIRILLGDTLIRDTFVSDDNFLYLAEVEDPSRWCMAVANLTLSAEINGFFEKEDELPVQSMAVAGYYHFVNGSFFVSCLGESIKEKESELSNVVERYMKSELVLAKVTKKWFDFGHIDKLVEAKRRLLGSRYFNSIKINPVLNTLTKISKNTKKLKNELYWYKNIPEELKVLSPRIIKAEKSENSELLEITQEYYGYPNLGELYIYGDIKPIYWNKIIEQLFLIHREFSKYHGSLDVSNIRSVYLDKTFARLEELYAQDDFWGDISKYDYLQCNGKKIKNALMLRESIIKYSGTFIDNCNVRVVHGDYCLSNILYDFNNQIIRLVDPRGSFGVQTVYGDPRYDVAKLSHSICGLYDFIVADLFTLNCDGSSFEYEIFEKTDYVKIVELFNGQVERSGYSLEEIKFIEGLLFLSMVPLHKDHSDRQKLMYLKGLEILNDILE